MSRMQIESYTSMGGSWWFTNGGFMTKTGNSNPFECIPMDQTFLQIVNNDTQTLGAKGLAQKGLALKKEL